MPRNPKPRKLGHELGLKWKSYLEPFEGVFPDPRTVTMNALGQSIIVSVDMSKKPTKKRRKL